MQYCGARAASACDFFTMLIKPPVARPPVLPAPPSVADQIPPAAPPPPPVAETAPLAEPEIVTDENDTAHGTTLRDLTAWLCSAVVHAAIGILLGMICFAAEPGWRDAFEVELQTSGEDVDLDTAQLDIEEAGGSLPAMSPLPELAEKQSEQLDEQIDQMFATEQDAQAESGSTGTSNSSGSGDGQGKGARYFGTMAYGDRFIYILDISSSMTEVSGSSASARSRYEKAAAELIRSINDLGGDQHFYVFLFSTDTRYMFDDRSMNDLLRATSANKRRLAEWLEAVSPFGNTDPREAVKEALEMKPSAVFLLSDGEFNGQRRNKHRDVLGGNPDVFEIVRDHSGPVAPVHTIAYEDRKNQGTLEKLSNMTGGKFRFVSPGPNVEIVDWDAPENEKRLASAKLRLAELLEQRGKPEIALRRYQEIVSEFPKTPQAEIAREHIDRLNAEEG